MKKQRERNTLGEIGENRHTNTRGAARERVGETQREMKR